MPAAPLPANEGFRVQALHALNAIQSASKPEFQALINAAALVCGVPFSAISLVDSDRVWIKAVHGMSDMPSSPRSESICSYAILGEDILEVPDATLDPRFSDNPSVIRAAGVRFYAGAPLRLSDGHCVGSLCVWNQTPHQLDATQRAILQSLALAVSRALEVREVESVGLHSAELLRASIDALDDAFVLYDPQDRLVICNQKFRDLYPMISDVIEPGTRFEDIIRAGAQRGLYANTNGRDEEWVAERLRVHRQAESTLIQRLSDGRVLRIGERKMPDGHTVGFRTDITDLVRATEDAQQASRAKGEFLANMSHEIRTPMNAMLGMLTLLRKTPLTTQQTDYVNKSEGATRLLLGVINDILDYSKIEAGHLTLDNQPFDLHQLVQDLQVMLSTIAGAKPIRLAYQIDLGVPLRLVGDAMRLQQVLVNLGGNAIKFTPQGQVQISIRLKERTPQMATLEVAVTDTGVGIAPENHARIFDGFSQAEASTTRRFGGTGLGLTISQRLVARMGGELKVASVLGQGSRFYFSLTLPYLPAVQTAAVAPPVSKSSRLAGLRLLVAEDNPASQQVARELLQQEGAVVQVAGDGRQAVEAIAARLLTPERFDLVLMDIQMPVMDGFTATRHIRQLMRLTDLPIVAMTANALDSDRKACLAAGMNAHVAKPFNLDHLVGVLQQQAPPGWKRPATGPDRPSHDVQERPAPPPPSTRPMDGAYQAAQLAGVDLNAALNRLGHNLPLYSRALRSFIDDLAAIPTQLQAHLAANEVSPAISTLHKLKGLAATLGVNLLADLAKQGESRLKVASEGQVVAELAHVVTQTCDATHHLLPGLIHLLKVLVANQPTSAPTLENPGGPDFGLAVRALASKLENFDMDALALMAGLKRTWGPSPALQPLEEAIDGLDFEEALRVCRMLAQDSPA